MVVEVVLVLVSHYLSNRNSTLSRTWLWLYFVIVRYKRSSNICRLKNPTSRLPSVSATNFKVYLSTRSRCIRKWASPAPGKIQTSYVRGSNKAVSDLTPLWTKGCAKKWRKICRKSQGGVSIECYCVFDPKDYSSYSSSSVTAVAIYLLWADFAYQVAKPYREVRESVAVE